MTLSDSESGKQTKGRKGLSDRAKKLVLAYAGGGAVIAGAVWAYFALTTVPPPNLQAAKPEQVTQYLSNPRGFARLPIPNREQFLQDTFQRFNKYEDRKQLVRSFRQMSPNDLQVLLDATYDVVHAMVMERAQEFNSSPSTKERGKVVDKLIGRCMAMQGELGGGGDPEQNVGEPFKQYMPTNSDELSKMLATRTTPDERTKVQPLVEAIAKRLQEIRQNPQAALNLR